MITFGLVHGAYHGSWQWGPLVAELERRGQRSACVNLPVDDPECGVPDYAALAAPAFADTPLAPGARGGSGPGKRPRVVRARAGALPGPFRTSSRKDPVKIFFGEDFAYI